MNIKQNIKKLFPAIPMEIVDYMAQAVDLEIVATIDKGIGASGIYYPALNKIELMYEGYAIVHEYGHMLHYAIIGVMGESTFERQWTALNEGIGYNGGRGGMGVYDFQSGRGAQGAVFYGDYATTDIFEDVAETFWLMVERPRDLEKLIDANAPLARKAALLDRILREQLLTADVAVVAASFDNISCDCDECRGASDGSGESPGWDQTYGESWYDEDWWSWGGLDSDCCYWCYECCDYHCDAEYYWCDECGEYHSYGDESYGWYDDYYWCYECGEYHQY